MAILSPLVELIQCFALVDMVNAVVQLGVGRTYVRRVVRAAVHSGAQCSAVQVHCTQ